MAKYRNGLPQLKGGTFITDGGMETTMIFQEGIELPHFAAFILLASEDGRQRMRNYYRRYLDIARAARHGASCSTPRHGALIPDWGGRSSAIPLTP